MSPQHMSMSPDEGLEDSENLDHSGDEGGKPGRKKNPNTQAARRDQNRIAQREFRLRKQQKIRDLEARVELLSGNKDEMYGQLRTMLRALMLENQQLRGLVRSLGGWIGDGSGGTFASQLSSIGWQMNQFDAFLNHTETDTAFDVFSSLKKTKGKNGAANGTAAATSPEDTTEGSSGKKRKRKDSTAPGSFDDSSSYLLNGTSVAGPGASSTSGDSFASFLGSSAFRDRPPPFIMGGPSSASSSNQVVAPSLHGLAAAAMATAESPPLASGNLPPVNPSSATAYHLKFTPQMGGFGTSGSGMATPQAPMASPVQTSDVGPLFGEEMGSVDDGALMRKNEAGRLFKYHLDNFRRNPSYCLPRILSPTLVQRTIPHEQIIDSVPFAELRDRMILLKDRFSLPEVLHMFFLHSTIHGDDILQSSNWEIQRPFLERYPFLAADTVLANANKWRKERGEAEITTADLNSNDS